MSQQLNSSEESSQLKALCHVISAVDIGTSLKEQ